MEGREGGREGGVGGPTFRWTIRLLPDSVRLRWLRCAAVEGKLNGCGRKFDRIQEGDHIAILHQTVWEGGQGRKEG